MTSCSSTPRPSARPDTEPSPDPAPGCIAALDLGTSHVKAALVDASGRTLAEAAAPLPTERGPHGRMHQHVLDRQTAVRAVLGELLGLLSGEGPSAAEGPSAEEDALASLGASAQPGDPGQPEGSVPPGEPAPSAAPIPPLLALAVTGQMQDLVLLGAAGEPTHPVVLYSDTEAEPELAELLAARPDWAARLLLAPGPDALPPKLLRLARTEPEAMQRSRRVLFSAAGWLGFALTGRSVCDRLTASTTSAYFTRTDDWFPFGPVFEPLAFPELTDPGTIGEVTPEAAAQFGLPAGLPVVMALGDAGAATDGMVGSMPGSLYLHLGTTGWAAHVHPRPASALPLPSETGEPGTHHRLTHPAGHLALARMPEAGEALERVRRRELGLEDPHSEAAHAAAEAALLRALAAEAGTGGGTATERGAARNDAVGSGAAESGAVVRGAAARGAAARGAATGGAAESGAESSAASGAAESDAETGGAATGGAAESSAESGAAMGGSSAAGKARGPGGSGAAGSAGVSAENGEVPDASGVEAAGEGTTDADRAYLAAVRALAGEVRELLVRLDAAPEVLPATGGVVRSAAVRTVLEAELGVPVVLLPAAEAGLRSCARVGFEALGREHTITPLVH
ncbi:FGGY family carbohydrate kinase [Brevibacterium sp.]|uniref:FGGY family carbohydrate kinase n=1 Tax=Brevibacterium sp. TaxID=1701 RepID=UPI0025C654B5|nr:FGGY family carbohydrate kinase [Brevibacterium sp.]